MGLREERGCIMANTSNPQGGRSRVQLVMAVVLSVCGIILIGAGFAVPPLGEVSPSILVAYGEVMTFAGALFGIDYHARRYSD